MKWRSVDEKPKRNGDYYLCYTTAFSKEVRFQYSNFETDRFSLMADIICWLDPEVPEHFLRQPEPVKCCPWCGMNCWEIIKIEMYQTYYYRCYFAGCGANGPQRRNEQEAEAAIFERVR